MGSDWLHADEHDTSEDESGDNLPDDKPIITSNVFSTATNQNPIAPDAEIP